MRQAGAVAAALACGVALVGLTSLVAGAQQGAASPESLLRGAIDIHVHTLPDDRPRSVDGIEAATLAKAKGMRAIVLKNHYESSAGPVFMVRKAVPGIEVFGGIDLNLTVGGMNPHAVEHMTKVTGGFGRIVWMSTFDAENAVRTAKENRPFVSVSRNGELLPETKAVIGVIAKHNLVLATGHVSAQEVLMVLREARRLGVRRMVVTHAMNSPISMTVAQMQEAAKEGAFIEFVGSALKTADDQARMDRFADAIKRIGAAVTILSSDLGQQRNALPADGFAAFLGAMHDRGISVADIEVMTKRNPATAGLAVAFASPLTFSAQPVPPASVRGPFTVPHVIYSMLMRGVLLCVGLMHMFVPDLALAQSEPAAGSTKSVRVTRVATPPTIDGRMDEAIWGQAEAITDFHQIRPGDGTVPSERTEVYLVYTEDALYVGARMFDSDPDRIVAKTARHGQGLGTDDRLVVILDPFNTRRGGYRFETNLNGVRHDALYESVNAFQSEWTAIWHTAASVFENGWTAELEIPFKSISFEGAIDTWGFNFGRSIRRRGEEMVWVSRNRSYNPSIMGLATGFADLDQGLGLDVVPSASVNRQRAYFPSATDSDFEPSLDAFYRVTPSLNASLTVNTDFSAAEVDDRQVNLTRFNLFFPEKRDFFLNDTDLFEFGRIGSGNSASTASSENNGRPFFSRRLGLSPTGAPVDLEYGGKLSGRVGRWSVGALAIRQDGFRDVDAGAAFVGRLSANVLEESSVGVIATSGDPNSNRSNSLVGFDFRYLNTHLPGGRVLEAETWIQKSDTEGVAGNDSAFGVGVRVPTTAQWRGGLGYKEVGVNFNPALGFVSRTNVRDTTADAGYTHFVRGRVLQTLFAGVDVERISLLDGGLQSSVVLARLIEVRTNTAEQLNVHYSATEEVVVEPFTIYEDTSRRVVVPPGRYSFGETVLSTQTGGQRTFSGGVTYRAGDFYGGSRVNVGGQFAWKQSRRFALGLRYDLNDIELPQGTFVTRLMRLTADVNFSSTLYWVNLIQYDNVSEVIGANLRLRWIPKAGHESLIVLNHRMQDRDKDNAFRSEVMDVSVRASYTFRF